MSMSKPLDKKISRRTALKMAGGALAATSFPLTVKAASGKKGSELISGMFQKNFKKMSDSEKEACVERLKRKYKRDYGKDFDISTKGAMDDVKFVYMLDIGRCIGCRKCVYGCVDENNQSRATDDSTQIHYVRVVKMEKGKPLDLEKADHYYDDKEVPDDDAIYMPIQCQQCENPPCTKACPAQATWKEKDGIVAIDYDWCIGCRFCMAACPYHARRFNWSKPSIPEDKLNTKTHYLGNRPREKGVVEKCHFCMQRSREGEYPACHEACPTGVRKFGNILDPNSEVSQIFKRYSVFRLKEELGTEPNFFYYSSK
jgi:Fe-S-cluster-containing dehydrogenase component